MARDGKAATGVVTKCIPDDRTFDLEYQFFTEDGLLVTGKTDSPDEYCAGARVWILYLPKRPRRNSMYPLSFFDIV